MSAGKRSPEPGSGGSDEQVAHGCDADRYGGEPGSSRQYRGVGFFIPALMAMLIIALGYTLDRLARVENQRYALMVGICTIDHANPKAFFDCLDTAETRTSWLWHVYYGLTSPLPAARL